MKCVYLTSLMLLLALGNQTVATAETAPTTSAPSSKKTSKLPAKKKTLPIKGEPASEEASGTNTTTTSSYSGGRSGGNAIASTLIGNNTSPSQVVTITPMIGRYALIGFEYGLKASVEILNDGLIGPLNDSISLEAGYFRGSWELIYAHYRETMEANISWDFHLLPVWSVYASSGLARVREWSNLEWDDTDINIEPVTAIGTMYSFTKNFAVRGEYEIFGTVVRAGMNIRI